MHVHISHQQHSAVKEKSQSNRASLHLVAHGASEPQQLVCFSYSHLFSYIFKKEKKRLNMSLKRQNTQSLYLREGLQAVY